MPERRFSCQIYSIFDGNCPSGEEAAAREMEKNIAKVIAAMPERRREIFEMSRTQKLSNAEIADRLGISIRTVEMYIENALSDIRHKLPVSILVLITLLF